MRALIFFILICVYDSSPSVEVREQVGFCSLLLLPSVFQGLNSGGRLQRSAHLYHLRHLSVPMCLSVGCEPYSSGNLIAKNCHFMIFFHVVVSFVFDIGYYRVQSGLELTV